MKNLFLFSTILIFNYSIFGQSNPETNPQSQHKLGFVITPKLVGFANFHETNNVSLNGFVSGIDGLISIKITENTNLETGLGYFEFFGNRSQNNNMIYLKNSYLQIPLKAKTDFIISKNDTAHKSIFFTTGYGFYTNTLLNQKTESISSTTTLKNLGWNFGVLGQFGVKYILSNKFHLEMGWEGQHDLSNMKKDNVERKINFLNTLYCSFNFKL